MEAREIFPYQRNPKQDVRVGLDFRPKFVGQGEPEEPEIEAGGGVGEADPKDSSVTESAPSSPPPASSAKAPSVPVATSPAVAASVVAPENPPATS